MSSAALLARDVRKSFGSRRVLDGVSLTVAPGCRLGLVGENGVGKSTVLRLLAGLDEPDDGQISTPGEVGFLHQELPFGAHSSVPEVLDAALAEIRAVEARLEEVAGALGRFPDDAELLAEYGDLLEWAQAHDLWQADHRAELVLAGLGLADVRRDRRLGTLSGGQCSRLSLAALLLRQPRALLLDEPTNHLDDAAISFLERHVAALPGAVVLASHDRVFLDAVCTDIVDLDPAQDGITRYGGAFSDYLRAKRAERARWEQRHAAEQDELTALRHAVTVTARQVSHGKPRGNTSKLGYDHSGGRVQKQVSRRVRNAQQRLDQLSAEQVRKPPEPLRFSATLTTTSTDEVGVRVRDVRVDHRLRVEELDLSGRDRLLVTGPNGAGKSSLLGLLAGRLVPDSGLVHRSPGLRVGALDQDASFADPDRSPRLVYAEATGGRADVPALAELGLLAPKDLDRPVGVLSAGQRRRLALAALLADPPQVLLLDEPTNHLSLTLAGELEDAMGTSAGAIVIASHDRWLRRRWNGAVLALDEGRVVEHSAPLPETGGG